MLRLSAVLAFLIAADVSAAAEPIRIVAFGDSATAGWLVARQDAYPAQLQAALRKKGYDVAVDNQGISGDTAAGALRRFDRAVAPGTKIAIVEFGTNDLRARNIEVLVIGLGSLDLASVAKENHALYAQWNLPPGQYRARDHAHYNAQGYAIVVARMLPQIETLIAHVARP